MEEDDFNSDTWFQTTAQRMHEQDELQRREEELINETTTSLNNIKMEHKRSFTNEQTNKNGSHETTSEQPQRVIPQSLNLRQHNGSKQEQQLKKQSPKISPGSPRKPGKTENSPVSPSGRLINKSKIASPSSNGNKSRKIIHLQSEDSDVTINNSTAKNGTSNGTAKNSTHNGASKNGTHNGALKNGSQNGAIKNGTHNGAIKNGSPNGEIKSDASDNTSQNSYGAIKNGNSNVNVKTGTTNGSVKNGARNGSIKHGDSNGNQQKSVNDQQEKDKRDSPKQQDNTVKGPPKKDDTRILVSLIVP